jgi:glycosyltransferase involved in cell wall biosynthesis
MPADRRIVLINAVSAVFGGGITVARSLTAAMARQRPSYRFVLFCSHPEVSAGPYPENVECVELLGLRSRLRRWWWEQTALPREVKRRGADVMLLLGGFASFATSAPQVAVWQNATIFAPPLAGWPLALSVYIRFQRWVQGLSMKCVSDNVFLTRDSIEKASRCWSLEVIPHRFIYNGVDDQIVIADHQLSEEREQVALSIGHSYFHKNYENLIDGMACYRDHYGDSLSLEIVGGAFDESYHAGLERRIRDLGLEKIVRMTGHADRQQISQKLSRARIYVVTSILETFGLTVLEAMGAGVPVVAASATCLPEVCGEAAVLCDPYDPEDIAKKMHQVASDLDLQRDLQRRGFERVKQFTWERSASGYIDALEDAMATSE